MSEREPSIHELAELMLARVELAELVPLRTLVRNYVLLVVDRCGGNKTEAARILGIHRRSLYRRLDRLDDAG